MDAQECRVFAEGRLRQVHLGQVFAGRDVDHDRIVGCSRRGASRPARRASRAATPATRASPGSIGQSNSRQSHARRMLHFGQPRLLLEPRRQRWRSAARRRPAWNSFRCDPFLRRKPAKRVKFNEPRAAGLGYWAKYSTEPEGGSQDMARRLVRVGLAQHRRR